MSIREVDDLVTLVGTITNEKILSEIQGEIWRAIHERQLHLKKEAVAPVLESNLVTAAIDFPVGTRVVIRDTQYRTLDGKAGTIVGIKPQNPVFGPEVYVEVRLDSGPRKSPRYMTTEDGNIRLMVTVDKRYLGSWKPQFEVIS